MHIDSADFVFDSTDDAAARYFYRPEVPRPAGAATQWLCFRFRSGCMVRHSPGSHFGIALRGRLLFDRDGVPCSISGRGITLGDTSQAFAPSDDPFARDPRFGGARGAQVESFWPEGNFLYRDTGLLPDGIEDGRWYHVTLHVNDARWIAFWIDDERGARLGEACVRDAEAHPVIADATGVVIALGRGPRESGRWSAEFRDIAFGWF